MKALGQMAGRTKTDALLRTNSSGLERISIGRQEKKGRELNAKGAKEKDAGGRRETSS